MTTKCKTKLQNHLISDTSHPLYSYKKNKLFYNGINLSDTPLSLPTPFYLYTLDAVTNNVLAFQQSFSHVGIRDLLICYALKANPNPHILTHVKQLGAGADIVSKGELSAAITAHIPPEKIVFSGVGKTKEEIIQALAVGPQGIRAFNVESLEELNLILACAQEANKTAHVAFRLNPSIKAPTHHLISTGNKSHKFGLLPKDILGALPLFKRPLFQKHLKLVGLSVHIGSQLLTFRASKNAFRALASLALAISDYLEGPLEFLDVGGGLGIAYHHHTMTLSPFHAYAQAVKSGVATYLHRYPCQIICEPGRSIIGNAGVFITRVIRVKKSGPFTFLVVDGGMNDFARPALYQAHHEIYPFIKRPGPALRANVVGPVCETSDCFAEGRKFSPVLVGDYLAIADTGAYGHSMASFYNLRSLPAELVIGVEKKQVDLYQSIPTQFKNSAFEVTSWPALKES
ncbi:MAG: diaminopimelate decarboxylase [Bdellovibrio sp.]|nr:diaminopimelate decarboxylase [Bdellovibrio sp.]